MASAVLPIIGAFILLQIITKRFKATERFRVVIGFIYTFLGLSLFMTGVNTGFLPIGSLFGASIAAGGLKWALIPLGMLIGYFIVKAEPAVAVLTRDVEAITDGAVTRGAMGLSLSVGVAASVGLSMLRVLTGIDIIWILLPGYAIAILLTFFVPKIFIGIAFDSGGVASGPMTSAFLLPLSIGASTALGGDVMRDAFGVVALVAMTPLIAVQVMGLVYASAQRKAERAEAAEPPAETVVIPDEGGETTEFDDGVFDFEADEQDASGEGSDNTDV
jgi:hypothetical protein